MKKPTNTRRPAAMRPRVFLDSHPNVICAMQILHPVLNSAGDIFAAPLFKHVHSEGTMPREKVALILALGLKAAGYLVTVREFDARGQLIA